MSEFEEIDQHAPKADGPVRDNSRTGMIFPIADAIGKAVSLGIVYAYESAVFIGKALLGWYKSIYKKE